MEGRFNGNTDTIGQSLPMMNSFALSSLSGNATSSSVEQDMSTTATTTTGTGAAVSSEDTEETITESLLRNWFSSSNTSRSTSTSIFRRNIPLESSNHNQRIEFKDVLQANPMEMEAETYVIRAVEEMEKSTGANTRTSTNVRRTSMLEVIPDTARTIFDTKSSTNVEQVFNDTQQPMLESRRTTSTSDPELDGHGKHVATKHRYVSTMEETLAELSNRLAHLQVEEQSQTSEVPDLDQQLKVDKQHLRVHQNEGSAGTFGKAVNVVLRKKNSLSASMELSAYKSQAEVQNGVHTSTEQESRRSLLSSTVPAGPDSVKDEVPIPRQTRITTDDMELGIARKDKDGGESSGKGVECEDDEMQDHTDHSNASHLREVVVNTVVSDLHLFVHQRKDAWLIYLRMFFLFVVSGVGVACLLFYVGDNPPTGRIDPNLSANEILVNEAGVLVAADKFSVSFLILFFVRISVTFALAEILQILIIDFCCLDTKIFVNMFGPLTTLLTVQTRGWPFLAIAWTGMNFALNYGPRKFNQHWLYGQNAINVFNALNPSGKIPDSDILRVLQIVVMVWGLLTGLKRLWLGLYLGKKTYTNYAEDLAIVMSKIVLLWEVAKLAKEVATDHIRNVTNEKDFATFLDGFVEEATKGNRQINMLLNSTLSKGQKHRPLDQCKGKGATNSFAESNTSLIDDLLGDWEEPLSSGESFLEEIVSISGVLQFRQSLSYLDTNTMFSLAWGDVSTRESMILNSQIVYKRLMLASHDSTSLSFDVLAHSCIQSDRSLDTTKLKALIKLLRPDRAGFLSMLDFVKSVDAVYKEARLLRASVRNNEKIDRALESVINVAFYTCLTFITLSFLGHDPLYLFASLSAILIGFAFIIGPAAARAFEGLLFILIRRPYDIGDRIHISNPEANLPFDGSASSFVRDLDLFTTTVVFAATGEKATLCNGSLASLRVINAARSPNAILYIRVKFPVDTPLSKVHIFDDAVRKFTKSRPREWAQLVAFRVSLVAQEDGFVEYVIVMQHRESWQNIGALLASKSEVSSFTLELCKKLGIRYMRPAMPINLSMVDKSEGAVISNYEGIEVTGGGQVSAMFADKSDKEKLSKVTNT